MWQPRMSRGELLRLAEEQFGVLTTAQSLAGGITRRRSDGHRYARTVCLDAAVALAARATQRQLTTAERLRTELRSRRGHQWTRELDEALRVVADGAESTLEVRFVRQVVHPHGLPAPRLQALAHAGRG